jgi:hypothetical protein
MGFERSTVRRLYGVIPLLAATACESDEPAETSAFVERLVAAWCDTVERCCGSAPGMRDLGRCKERHGLDFAGYPLWREDRMQRGFGQYDAVAARGCLDALESAHSDCSIAGARERIAVEAVCNRVFTGKLALGARCKYASECAQVDGHDVSCFHAGSFDSPEVCTNELASLEVPHAVSGEPCGGTCEARDVTDIALCALTRLNDLKFCYWSDGLYCDATSGSCAEQRAVGEPCERNEQCLSDVCGDERRCEAVSDSVCSAFSVELD